MRNAFHQDDGGLKQRWRIRDFVGGPKLRGRVKADVAVIGAGLSGLTTAYTLSKTGLKVAVVEAGLPGRGISSACCGIVSLSNGLFYSRLEREKSISYADAYVRTQKSAFQAVRDIAFQADANWEEVSVRLIAQSFGEREALHEEMKSMQRYGISCSAVTDRDKELFLKIDRMGKLNAQRYIQFMTEHLLQAGIPMFCDSRVISMDMDTVYTQEGSVRAPYIVISTGYPIINTPGWYFLKLEQRRGWVRQMSGTPMFEGVLHTLDGKCTLYSTERSAWMQLFGAAVGTDQNDRYPPVIQRHAGNLSFLAEKYERIETFSMDGLPFIGAYSRKTPNLFVACGYGGRGLIGSMAAAQAISARILGLPAEGYDIYSQQRPTPLQMPLRIIGRYLRSMIVNSSAPFCPHMGCRMVYDESARMWKCPCHGSQFDDIGRWMNAPAVHDAVIRHRR